jgi:hypothetical protein
MNIESIMRFAIAGLIGMVLLCMTLAGIAFAAGNRPDPGRETDNPGKIHGIAFESLQVSNLERSVKYYRALGFALMSDANQPWTVDEAAWSQGGIVQRKDGSRAVVVRDPDVGAFVELFERP